MATILINLKQKFALVIVFSIHHPISEQKKFLKVDKENSDVFSLELRSAIAQTDSASANNVTDFTRLYISAQK